MASCKECIYFEVCQSWDCSGEIAKLNKKIFQNCPYYKNRSRFVKLPIPLKVGDELYYRYYNDDIFAENKWQVSDTPDIVTAVMQEGFFVAVSPEDTEFSVRNNDFYKWSAIGNEYFLTRKEAEMALEKINE